MRSVSLERLTYLLRVSLERLTYFQIAEHCVADDALLDVVRDGLRIRIGQRSMQVCREDIGRRTFRHGLAPDRLRVAGGDRRSDEL